MSAETFGWRTGGAQPVRAIEVEVAYAEPERQIVRRVRVTPGATLREVVEESGLHADIPELSSEHLDLGVFGRRMDPQRTVQPGDRVEVYRPLGKDPKEIRRARAGKRLSRVLS